MTVEEVIHCWIGGKPAAGASGHIHTDGVTLYSYSLAVARREKSKVVILVPFISVTTSRHIGLAKRVAEECGLEVTRDRLEGGTSDE